MNKDDMKTSSVIVKFYRGKRRDAEGRMIDEIRSWDHKRLEHEHDYIQWLFPLRKPSQFNADAPILTDADIRTFMADERLRKEVVKSFDVMLSFYGFTRQVERRAIVITRA